MLLWGWKKAKKRWGLGGAEATKGVISSEIKRKVIEEQTERGLYPYCARYLKNAKEKVINSFMKKMNNLLDEYQLYINGLKSIDTIGTNNNIDIEISASSNLQTIKHKEIIDNSTFTSKVSL